ncbi:MAG: hypothetical protein JSS66_06595 [Armatimonadetes bacterium]|nr:hypothetical protein [Armatimonadota bacterium]
MVDPSAGGVHLGTQPVDVQAHDPGQLAHIRNDFMQSGIATPVRLNNGKTVIIAHGAPPVNGQRMWFIGPSAAAYADGASTNGWLNEEQAKKWAAGQGYAGAEFISCYNGGAFDNTGPIEIGVPEAADASSFTVKGV